MHHSTRSNDLQDLRFDQDIETMARGNQREARLRRAEMGVRNAQLEHVGLPPMANQMKGNCIMRRFRFKRVCLMLEMSAPYGITQCRELSIICHLSADQQLRQIPLK